MEKIVLSFNTLEGSLLTTQDCSVCLSTLVKSKLPY